MNKLLFLLVVLVLGIAAQCCAQLVLNDFKTLLAGKAGEKDEAFRKACSKSMSSLKKIYEKRDLSRRETAEEVKKALDSGKWENQTDEIATKLYGLFAEATQSPPKDLMLDLHTLHVIEGIFRNGGSGKADTVHKAYGSMRLFFQTEGFVRILIWGSLLAVFGAASYQTVFTIKKRV